MDTADAPAPTLEELLLENEELRRAKASLESVMKGATDAVFSVDARLVVLTANSEFTRRLHASAGIHVGVGSSLANLWPEHRIAWSGPMQQAFAGETVQFEFELSANGRDGKYVVRIVPVVTDGVVTAVSVFSRDVTDARRDAQAVAEMDRLAAVGTVAAGVAHEIANPLTFVLSHLDAALAQLARSDLAETDPLPRVRSLLTDARYGAHRIHDVVKDLRSFCQPDDRVLRPIALGNVVDRALTMAAGEIRGRARVEKQHDAHVPKVLGSEGRLSQVALNLVVNAAQALPEDGRDHVITSVIRLEGNDVVFEVLDTGIGVSRDAIQHAFEPFFTTKAKGAGTGLGLSISKQIVIAHHGELSLANRPEGGAIARVRLPACI